MGSDLTLVDQAGRRFVNVFDRVFHRDDVVRPRLVDQSHHGGHGRRFAAAGRTGKKHHSLVVLNDPLEVVRQTKVGQSRGFVRDDAKYRVKTPLLLVRIGAKTADTRQGISKVELHPVFELRALLVVQDRPDDRTRMSWIDQLGRSVFHAAVHAQAKRRHAVHVQVAGTDPRRLNQKVVEGAATVVLNAESALGHVGVGGHQRARHSFMGGQGQFVGGRGSGRCRSWRCLHGCRLDGCRLNGRRPDRSFEGRCGHRSGESRCWSRHGEGGRGGSRRGETRSGGSRGRLVERGRQGFDLEGRCSSLAARQQDFRRLFLQRLRRHRFGFSTHLGR